MDNFFIIYFNLIEQKLYVISYLLFWWAFLARGRGLINELANLNDCC